MQRSVTAFEALVRRRIWSVVALCFNTGGFFTVIRLANRAACLARCILHQMMKRTIVHLSNFNQHWWIQQLKLEPHPLPNLLPSLPPSFSLSLPFPLLPSLLISHLSFPSPFSLFTHLFFPSPPLLP